jgi:NUMOD3 motif
MREKERFRLLFGPYQAPAFEYGQTMFCEHRGEVVVDGLSGGPIPWPMQRVGGARCLILMGDLVRAVRRESAQAVAHWWGVSMSLVWRWRRALGVELCNEGTFQLRHEYGTAQECLEGLKKAVASSLKPESLAKRGDSYRGHRHSEETKRKLSETLRGRKMSVEAIRKSAKGHRGKPNPGVKNRWGPEEDQLLLTLRLGEVMRLTGRTKASCQGRRKWLREGGDRKPIERLPAPVISSDAPNRLLDASACRTRVGPRRARPVEAESLRPEEFQREEVQEDTPTVGLVRNCVSLATP